jgi:RNA polymerase sigma-70 factor (ECF subfamily)
MNLSDKTMDIKDAETETDKSFLSRISNGETKLYAHIVRRYNDYLYKMGRSYSFNHSDTEDLMQETYVNAYLNLSKFENRSTFKTWLTRIMLNECYHKKKRQQREGDQSISEVYPKGKRQMMFTDHNEDTEEKVNNNELARLLEDAIMGIPEKYRMVFTLRELNGLSVKETSEALDLTESNVKVRLHRGKDMLQDELLKNYNPKEIFEFNLIYCDDMVDRVMDAISHKVPG